MPRKPLIRSFEHPYHLTARCNNKEHFPIPLYDVWTVCSVLLHEVSEQFHCEIHAFVLMSNHFHLLISSPKTELAVVMQWLMLMMTKKINEISGRSGRVFGSRYHGSLITHDHYYDCALKYIYRNPVKARLSDTVDGYPFSTIQEIMKKGSIYFPLVPLSGHSGLIPYGGKEDFLDWLNQPFQSEQEKWIKKGFQKTEFDPPNVKWTKETPPLEQYRTTVLNPQFRNSISSLK